MPIVGNYKYIMNYSVLKHKETEDAFRWHVPILRLTNQYIYSAGNNVFLLVQDLEM